MVENKNRVRESESKNQVRESESKSKIRIKLENQNPLTKNLNKNQVSESKSKLKSKSSWRIRNIIRESESNQNQIRESESGLSWGSKWLHFWATVIQLFLLILTAKRRQRVTAIVWRFLSVRMASVFWEKVHTQYQGRVVTLSPPQWCIVVCSCCQYGTYLSYMTDFHSVPCWSVVCNAARDSVNRQWLSSA